MFFFASVKFLFFFDFLNFLDSEFSIFSGLYFFLVYDFFGFWIFFFLVFKYFLAFLDFDLSGFSQVWVFLFKNLNFQKTPLFNIHWLKVGSVLGPFLYWNFPAGFLKRMAPVKESSSKGDTILFRNSPLLELSFTGTILFRYLFLQLFLGSNHFHLRSFCGCSNPILLFNRKKKTCIELIFRYFQIFFRYFCQIA